MNRCRKRSAAARALTRQRRAERALKSTMHDPRAFGRALRAR
jgi:hypothetical protein